MWRFRFSKLTQIHAQDYAPGAEADFDQVDTDELCRVGAGEVLGPASEYAAATEPPPLRRPGRPARAAGLNQKVTKPAT